MYIHREIETELMPFLHKKITIFISDIPLTLPPRAINAPKGLMRNNKFKCKVYFVSSPKHVMLNFRTIRGQAFRNRAFIHTIKIVLMISMI